MREILGVSSSDSELSAFLKRANGDLNQAVNLYLEGGSNRNLGSGPPPPASSVPKSRSSISVPAAVVAASDSEVPYAQAVGAKPAPKKKGWF